MPIILAVAERGGVQDDWMLRLDEGLALVPLKDAVGGLQVRRGVVGAVTVSLFAPLSALRLMLREEFLDARGLLLYPLDRLGHVVLCGGAGGRSLLG
jgi:hypothetical protein